MGIFGIVLKYNIPFNKDVIEILKDGMWVCA